jgi:hypothetical protein
MSSSALAGYTDAEPIAPGVDDEFSKTLRRRRAQRAKEKGSARSDGRSATQQHQQQQQQQQQASVHQLYLHVNSKSQSGAQGSDAVLTPRAGEGDDVRSQPSTYRNDATATEDSMTPRGGGWSGSAGNTPNVITPRETDASGATSARLGNSGNTANGNPVMTSLGSMGAVVEAPSRSRRGAGGAVAGNASVPDTPLSARSHLASGRDGAAPSAVAPYHHHHVTANHHGPVPQSVMGVSLPPIERAKQRGQVPALSLHQPPSRHRATRLTQPSRTANRTGSNPRRHTTLDSCDAFDNIDAENHGDALQVTTLHQQQQQQHHHAQMYRSPVAEPALSSAAHETSHAPRQRQKKERKFEEGPPCDL